MERPRLIFYNIIVNGNENGKQNPTALEKICYLSQSFKDVLYMHAVVYIYIRISCIMHMGRRGV